MSDQVKIKWQGKILSIQPRTNVWRYILDNRTHYHIGYNLFLEGSAEGNSGNSSQFVVAISEKQQQNYDFHVGDEITGSAWTKKYPECEYADYYRASAFKKISTTVDENVNKKAPPWIISPPDMKTYEWRGARMLSISSWKGKCFQCIWANMANVTIEYDWGRIQKYRFESFCYGPKSCKLYKKGRSRGVPYKGKGTFYDEGWLDDICTENRGYDD